MQDDAQLLDSLRAGDESAFNEIFDTYSDRIYYLALRLLRDQNEAEDILQDSFLKLITKIDQFRGKSTLGTWLYRIAYNTSLDRLRHTQVEPLPGDDPDEMDEYPLPIPETLVEWQTPELLLSHHEERLLLDQAIQEIPEALRVVFILRDIDELSTSETAEVLGISLSLVKVRLHRARLYLRERLSELFSNKLAIQE